MLDMDGAPNGKEIEAAIGNAQRRIRIWRRGTGLMLLSFVADSGFVLLISDLGPLHSEWRRYGVATLVVWFGILLALVYYGAMWWSTAAALRDLEKTCQ